MERLECKDCRWFNLGRCYRYPPTTMTLNGDTWDGMAVRPHVSYSERACGEFSGKNVDKTRR